MPSNQHSLFDGHLVEEYLNQQTVDKLGDTGDITDTIEEWDAPESVALGERNLQGAFNSDIFSDILDYKRPRPGSPEFQLFPEQYAETGEGFPDVLLGHFTQTRHGNGLETDIRKVVGELKEPGTDLDKVDPSRMKSPVEQAFEYARTNGLAVRWVVVSNMEEIRLYHHGSIDHYKTWYISDFLNDAGNLTDSFWEFYYIMHRDYLIGSPGDGSQVENLLQQNLAERLELTEGFYEFYRDAVEDVYETIADTHPDLVATSAGQVEVIQAAQKLLHRGLVICFFSDHPSNLLPDDVLREVVNTGKNLPTLDEPKIYPLIQDLFRVIDVGSPEEYPYDIYGYDGGLFEEDDVLTAIELPDELFTKEYEIRANGDVEYTLEGIFGFHKLDFNTELNEHVLGRIFEESVGDIEQVRANLAEGEDNPFSGDRGEYGLYFTREGLTEFVSERAIQDILEEKRQEVINELGIEGAEVETDNPDVEFLENYLDAITEIRIADIACGSGAFLVSCFNHLSREAQRVHEKLREQGEAQTTLRSFAQTEVEILDQCLHGNDILQESIEISKLSVWLRSARKNRSLAELTGNFASEDALAGEINFEDIEETAGFGEFDLVIGNPPWGAESSDAARDWMQTEFGDEWDIDNLDTYELFILVALKYLKDDGRLAYVLPQTLLRPDKEPIRRHLLSDYAFERFHVMGADWFGPDIRMNTVTMQLQNREPEPDETFRSMTLVDEIRRKAIDGELSLSQLESAYSFDIPQRRCLEDGEIEPFRYVSDDDLLDTMEANSIPIGAFCKSYRGVELNKAGHVIKCPGCGKWIAPPRGRDPDTEKTCPFTDDCGVEFEYQDRLGEVYLASDNPGEGDVLYMDGDSFGERFDELELKGFDLGYDGVNYKDETWYEEDKLFIREAGVGVSVAYEDRTVYCPRSVYIYKIRGDRDAMIDQYDEDEGWTDPDRVPSELDGAVYHKFLQAVLDSRVLHYYVFKRSGEIDAAQAFANMRQTDVRELPVPVAKLATEEGREKAREIADCVDQLRHGDAELGSDTDWNIEQLLLDLYGLDRSDMVYINQQMGLAAYHDKMQQLYPDEKPSPPERKDEIAVSAEAIEADD